MTRRVSVEPAPGPLEDYAVRFDDLFANRAQREGFRRYLEGLLLPDERNKTLTALTNTESVPGAQAEPRARRSPYGERECSRRFDGREYEPGESRIKDPRDCTAIQPE